jgi:hypothetical protein
MGENLFSKYLEEVKAIDLLPQSKDVISLKTPIKVKGHSICNLIIIHAKSLLKFCLFYPLEVWRIRNYIFATIQLKNSRINKGAILIGSGPSKGLLDVKKLDNFVKAGGETIVVNYWSADLAFSSHVPTWIVFSDPFTFNVLSKGSSQIVSYLRLYPEIKLLIPVSLLDVVLKLNLTNSINLFIDTECSFSNNINPLFPRGYLSMTLYKALAWAHYLNYNKIGVIGMDNSYVRSLYSNEKNEVLEVQLNSGNEPWVRNASSYYYNMAARLDDLTILFHHLSYFPKKRIFNLDVYSLTDRFDKMNFENFLKK